MQSDRFQAEVAAVTAAAAVVLAVAAACKRTSFVFVFINEK